MGQLVRQGHADVLRDWRAFSYAALRLAQFAPAGEARFVPDGALITTGEDNPDWNWAFLYGYDDPEDTLRAFVKRLRQRVVPGYVIAASALMSRVRPTAEELGLERVDDIPLMVLEPPPQPAAGCERRPGHATTEPRFEASSPDRRFEVRVIRDAETLALGRAVLAEAFDNPREQVDRIYRPLLLDLPGVHALGAWSEGEMVSYLTSVPEGDAVWFFDVGTVPARRRKGAATALLSAAIEYYRERGWRRFGLGADLPGIPLYVRLGFETLDAGAAWLLS
jgi:GNAT superfamily N-acetyltransferase